MSGGRERRLAEEVVKIIHCDYHTGNFGMVFVLEDHSFCFVFNDHSKYKVAQDHHHGHYIYRQEGEVTFQ